jgi:acyl-CoA thioesterase I
MLKIVAIGDSITEGFPYSPADSWVELAALELGVNIINRGLCGDLTGDILNRFPQHVISLNPSHIIIMGGTNDTFARVPLSTVAANFTAMVTACSNHRILPIFGLPIPSMFPADEAFLTDYGNGWNPTPRQKKFRLSTFTPHLPESLNMASPENYW